MVTLNFDKTVAFNDKLEILDNIGFDNIELMIDGAGNLRIAYTTPTIVAFNGYEFDKQVLSQYLSTERLPARYAGLKAN